MKKHWKCARRKCGWIGTEDEQAKRPMPDFPGGWTMVCPVCGNESFYRMKAPLESHASLRFYESAH